MCAQLSNNVYVHDPIELANESLCNSGSGLLPAMWYQYNFNLHVAYNVLRLWLTLIGSPTSSCSDS